MNNGSPGLNGRRKFRSQLRTPNRADRSTDRPFLPSAEFVYKNEKIAHARKREREREKEERCLSSIRSSTWEWVSGFSEITMMRARYFCRPPIARRKFCAILAPRYTPSSFHQGYLEPYLVPSAIRGPVIHSFRGARRVPSLNSSRESPATCRLQIYQKIHSRGSSREIAFAVQGKGRAMTQGLEEGNASRLNESRAATTTTTSCSLASSARTRRRKVGIYS